VTNGFVRGSVDLSRLAVPIEIAAGEDTEIDMTRVPAEEFVQTTSGAVEAVVRFLERVRASISAISYVETTAQRAQAATGVATQGLPHGTRAWLFEARGDFQLMCGGFSHAGSTSLRLLVVEARAAPYVVYSAALGAPLRSPTPAPLPELSEFGTPITLVPGEWPAIDQFRRSDVEIDATATAIATSDFTPC
jgi:hypothetical protein